MTQDALAGNSIVFSLNNIRNPKSIRPTSSFTAHTYYDSSSLSLVDEIVSGVSIVAIPAIVGPSNLQIVLNSYRVFENTEYTFTYTPSNYIPILSTLEIILPSDIRILNVNSTQASFKAISPAIGLDAVPYCGSDKLTITKFNNADLPPGTNLTFTFSGIINPNSLKFS